MEYRCIIFSFFCFLGLMVYSANLAPSRYPEREVIRSDSFTMLNIIPSSPGSEEVAAADAIEFVERSEMTGDFLILPKSSKPPVIRALPGAKTLSSLIWRESAYAKNFERVAPACILFCNRLGGEVAVMS